MAADAIAPCRRRPIRVRVRAWLGAVCAALAATASAGNVRAEPATQPSGPVVSKWSAAEDGLQTRLTLTRGRVAVGRPLGAFLDVRNVSDHAIEVTWAGAFGRLASVERVTKDGAVAIASKDKSRIEPSRHSQVLQPGLQINAWYVRLSREFEMIEPGTYRVRWPRLPAEKYAAKGRLPPASPALTVRLTAPESRAEPHWLDDVPWSKASDGLQTRLIARRRRFRAGHPIRIRLEMRNAGDRPRRYYGRTGIVNGGVSVATADGRGLSFLGHMVSTASRGPTIEPGRVVTLDEFDVSDYYYLRKPGRYVLRYEGERAFDREYANIPASPALEITVAADPAAQADGDPVGKLLAAAPKGWLVGGSPNAWPPWVHVQRPGWNAARVRCRLLELVHESYRPKGPRGPHGVMPVNVWIAEARVREEPWQPLDWEVTGIPPTEYLGGSRHYHVYVHVPPSAAKAWATVRADVAKALRVRTRPTSRPATAPATRPAAGKQSKVLAKAAVELLARAVLQHRKATGKLPPGATKAQFVVRFFQGLDKLDPHLLHVTAERERALERGSFDDRRNAARMRAAIAKLEQLRAELPWISRYIIEWSRKGELKGAELEVGRRIAEAHLRTILKEAGAARERSP